MTTFVLVHGAWHTAHCWARVVPLLGRAGHRVFTPTLTGYGETAHLMGPQVGLDTHVDDVARLLVEADLTDVVLVGHSYSGLVVSGAANRAPERVARLVYLDAMVPEDGESAADVLPITQAIIDSVGDGWAVPPPPDSGEGRFGVTDPDDLAWLATMLSDQSVRCLQQPVTMDDPRLVAVPRTHIRCTVRPAGFEDRPVPPVQPNGTPAEVFELPTGHDCMLTTPAELAALLITVGSTTRSPATSVATS